jgi:TPR repeat protein
VKKVLFIPLLLGISFFPGYIALVHIGASKGSLSAQGTLGYWYDAGAWLHSKDRDKAVYWYQKAAAANDPMAQFNLGLVMAAEKNFTYAAKWHLHAALQDYAPSQNSLAILYLEGKGVERNAEKAIFWAEKAAIQGNKHAQYLLGKAYSKGEGVRKDRSKSAYWIEKAASNDLAPAQTHLAMLYMLGDGVSVNNDLALEWAKKGLSNGDPKAVEIMGLIKEIQTSEN